MICVGDKILMGCGSNDNGNLNDWWEYDIPSNTWSTKPNLPGLERHHPFYFDMRRNGTWRSSRPGTNPVASTFIQTFTATILRIQHGKGLVTFPARHVSQAHNLPMMEKDMCLVAMETTMVHLMHEMWSYNPVNDNWNPLPSTLEMPRVTS